MLAPETTVRGLTFKIERKYDEDEWDDDDIDTDGESEEEDWI